MSMVMTQALLETKLFLRTKASLFWTMVFPIMFMGLFGLIYQDTKWPGMDIRSVDYLLPGIIVMSVMVTGIMYMVQAFVAEREKGVYRRLALTPLKRQWLIGGQIPSASRVRASSSASAVVGTRKNSSAPACAALSMARRSAAGVKQFTVDAAHCPTSSPITFMYSYA